MVKRTMKNYKLGINHIDLFGFRIKVTHMLFEFSERNTEWISKTFCVWTPIWYDVKEGNVKKQVVS